MARTTKIGRAQKICKGTHGKNHRLCLRRAMKGPKAPGRYGRR